MMLTSTVMMAAEASQDRRSQELLEYACSSASGQHQLTLFGNGTLRLREKRGTGPETPSHMVLAELTADELEDFKARLRTRAYDRVQSTVPGGPSGEWVEQCRLTVAVDDAAPAVYRFSRIESLPLDLDHLLRIAEELLVEVKDRSRFSGFPSGYEPRAGDVLYRVDGSRYRIERFTSDGGGLEISGLDEPLVLYIGADQVTGEFAGLLSGRNDRP